MTVATTANRQSYNGDDATIEFVFTFKAFEASDIKVVVRSALGVETTLTLDTDYTVAVLATTGGTVTLIGTYAATPPATGETVTVYRDLPYTQEIDPVENDPQRADVAEEGLDRAVILIQQLKDAISRSIQLPVSTAFSDLSLPEPVAGKYLGWNDDGDALENRELISSVGVSSFMAGMLNDEDAAAVLASLSLDADLATFSLPASTTISAFAKTLLGDADAAAARATLGITGVLPLNYLSGLTIAHAADTEHDITVAAGKARDATDTDDMVLASAITKQFDAEWSVGSAAGGFASGETLPASGTIHIWLIKRADTGVVDVFANDHATSGLTPTLPTDYDYKRRIFSLRTDASNNIINGDQWGTGLNRIFMYDTPILDVDAVNPGTNAVTAALSTPGGIKTRVFTNVGGVPGGTGEQPSAYISSLDNADLAPSATAAPLASMNDVAATPRATPISAITNTSSQIRYRCGNTAAALKIKIATIGWEDSL